MADADRQYPIRVLHVITRMIIGGAQENTLLSVEGLSRLPDYNVALVSGVDRGAEGTMVTRARQTTEFIIVPELYRNVHPFADVIALWKLYALIRKGRYHIVHTHLAKAGILGRLAAWLARTPIIVHGLHGLVSHDYQPRIVNRIWWLAQKLCDPVTDHYISVSQVLAERIIRDRLATQDRMSVVYSGMELEWFLDANVDRLTARRRLGISDDALVIGKIARMVPGKNHGQLLDAAREIIVRQPRARILLVGDGPLLDEFRARADQMGVLDRITFAGLVEREQIPEMLAAMDVVVSTSLYEGLPRVLVQALAMGRPCVAFDADGTREVVISGKTGFLVPIGDTTAFVEAVDRLLSDASLRERMGQAGRSLVDPVFRAETMVSKIDGVYQDLVSQYADRLARFEARSERRAQFMP